jgi:hypothetical protein
VEPADLASANLDFGADYSAKSIKRNQFEPQAGK